MKISHTQLDQCLLQPRQWLREQSAQKFVFKMGYGRVLKLSIGRYHKMNSASDARRYMHELIAKHDLKNNARIDENEVTLDLYMKWHQKSGVNTADSMTRIQLDVGGYLQLSGIISRVDVTNDGYHGILFGVNQTNWKSQLRMPLIQKALADKYVRPVQDISVGVQGIDGSTLDVITFSPRQIRQAKEVFMDLGERIRALAP
jgi:hypothetical protein